MNFFRPLAVFAMATIAIGVVAVSPAQAAEQSLFGTTVDVIAQPSGDALLGSTAHVPMSGGALVPTLAASLGSDVTVTLLDGAITVDSCTIASGSTTCVLTTGVAFPAGPTAVTVRFATGPTTVDYTGTIFAVTNVGLTVSIQWQDAAGTWIDGSGIGLALRGTTALRCVVTNNSNAPVTFTSFSSTVTLPPSGMSVVPIAGTLAPGAITYHPIWSGLATQTSGATCSGGVSLPDGTGTGGGTSGGVIGIGGTITVNRTPAPGTTVAITANLLMPPVVTEYSVLLNGVPVTGSPVAVSGPDFGFSIDVDIPASLAPGDHLVTVVATYSGRDSALAAFPFQVAAPQLAATGSALDTGALSGPAALALLVIGAGALLTVTARRRRAS